MRSLAFVLTLGPLALACSGAGEAASSLRVSPAQLRQGRGDAELLVQRVGAGLSNASDVSLEGLTVSVLDASSDEQLRLAVSVPHGASLGPHTLAFRTANGQTQRVTLEVTAITAASDGDDTGAGTRAAPFRSFSRALLASGEGDTVVLGAGGFEAPRQSLDHSLSVRGMSAADTVIYSGLTLERCDDCTWSISNATLRVDSAEPALTLDSTSKRGALTLTDANVAGGLLVQGTSATTVVTRGDFEGSLANAALNFSGSALSVAGSTIRAGGSAYGVSMRFGSLSLDDVTLEGGSYSVYQIFGDAKLRRARLIGYQSVGYYYAGGSLDLGTESDAGDNAFSGAASGTGLFGIYVNTGALPITSSNTRFEGVVPVAGTVTASASEIVVPGAYFLNPGQTIRFYRVGG